MWINKAGSDEIAVVKPDKQPVGLYEGMKKFTSHQLSLQKGDQLYLFADGYADQFGGDKGKKLKYKSFKNLLLKSRDKSLDEQRDSLLQSFESWKGSYEQIDDVCVIGIRI